MFLLSSIYYVYLYISVICFAFSLSYRLSSSILGFIIVQHIFSNQGYWYIWRQSILIIPNTMLHPSNKTISIQDQPLQVKPFFHQLRFWPWFNFYPFMGQKQICVLVLNFLLSLFDFFKSLSNIFISIETFFLSPQAGQHSLWQMYTFL